jgi:hypothetical protein
MSFGEEFLRHPDLFPGRRSGEPWGEGALALAIPGGPYRLTGLAASQEEALRHRFGPLCGPMEETAGGIPTTVFRAPASDFLEIDTRGWEYSLDVDRAPSSLRMAGMRLMARVGWEPVPAGALWTPDITGEEWTSVCENYLRLVAAYRLLAEGGALLHSAGLSDGEWAWLLLGPSGAGKTTASRLCLAAGAEVLSDDLNAVLLPVGERPMVARLPFTGDLGGDLGGEIGEVTGASVVRPLRGVLRLRQGPAEALARLSPASTLAALVAAAPYVNHDPWRREPLLETLETLAFAVPAWELTFSLGADLWSILRSIPPPSGR